MIFCFTLAVTFSCFELFIILVSFSGQTESMIKYYTKSSCQRCSVRKDVLRNSAKSTGKHLCQSLFLIKRRSGPDVLLWNFRNFEEHLFYRAPLDDCLYYTNSVTHRTLIRCANSATVSWTIWTSMLITLLLINLVGWFMVNPKAGNSSILCLAASENIPSCCSPRLLSPFPRILFPPGNLIIRHHTKP